MGPGFEPLRAYKAEDNLPLFLYYTRLKQKKGLSRFLVGGVIIRDHKVILSIRRRRWTDIRPEKSFALPIDLDIVAKGTRYSKEFGAFLKETYGDIPGDLPYA